AVCPGAAVGHVVFTADDAVAKGKTQPVILVRSETVPDDIHGMEVAAGILTSRGGMTSHAAVVTRGMGKCCVAGAGECDVDEKKKVMKVGKHVIKEGDWISLDGSTGRVILGKANTVWSLIRTAACFPLSWNGPTSTANWEWPPIPA